MIGAPVGNPLAVWVIPTLAVVSTGTPLILRVVEPVTH